MPTLQGAIAEIVDTIATVNGINHTPDEPEQQITLWPAAMTFVTEGSLSDNRASVEDKSLHNIAIAVLMPLNDMRQCMLTMLPLYEPIVAALIGHLNGRTSSHYQSWLGLNYTLGPIDWPQGDQMFGYLFQITGLKIMNDI